MRDLVTLRDLPTVLLIDDDMVSREVMATVLTMNGYTVHTAEDGPAALRLIDTGACIPAVVLMDARMSGLHGVDLIAQLRLRSQAVLFAISASNPPPEVLSAADGFLLKPITPTRLQQLYEERQIDADSPPPPAPEPAVVNPEILAQFRSIMPEPKVREIYAAVVADLARKLDALAAAIARGSFAEARSIGHAIKGGCGMAGALQAARLGAMIESGVLEPQADRGTVNQVDNSAPLLLELQSAHANLQRMLELEFPA